MPEARTTARTSARRALAALAAGAAALALVACSPGDDGGDPTVVDPGYQEGTGAFTTWSPAERTDAPQIAGVDFDGNAIDLADWRGDVVVLNFWYAACPPCRAEAPDLVSIADTYAGDGVRLLGVNGTDDAATANAFKQTYGITFPSLDDGDATAVAALEGLVPLRAMPTTVVLDTEGRPAARIVGLATETTLAGLIDDVLAEG
ncbi:TlpA family protein disulfide reductase [Litorihabitans aurantiacus]|uniref:Thiol-disulfide isomerase n=1 Tax=Litorihabitans aurantiacus TaxID=1930061 RepID=A0AA38CQP0_9MICO|nr:TlpA disulfide reductase family protein [Litorihabitans aurantiacus]GMA32408.1 thiol-disulfide isomerase [Litorihabitans aurantiacus]